jgi:DNA-binding transcriptional LysR family regulator
MPNNASLSLDSLRCFTEAARLLSFRGAARAVALSPAALGQRIRQLEQELGVAVFHRTTRTVVLTEAGLRLLPYAHKVLAAAEDCVRAGRGTIGPTPVELVIGTRHELGLSWLVPLVDDLQRAIPGLTVHVYFGSGPDLIARVRSLAIDCAVTSARILDPKLDELKLHEERYVFVGAASLLAKQPFRNAKDAHHHTLLDTTDELPLFRYWRDAPGGVDSLEFGGIVKLGTIAAIRLRVLAGQGVAVLPEYFIRKDLKRGALVSVLPRVTPLSDHFRLTFRIDDPRRSLFARLAQQLKDEPLR